MKNFTTALGRTTVLAFVLCTAAALTPAFAQTPTTGGPTPEEPQAATDVPLDGGASLLLAGGVAYGLRRLRQRRQSTK